MRKTWGRYVIAQCDDCQFTAENNGAIRKGRLHAEQEKHRVHVDNTRMTTYYGREDESDKLCIDRLEGKQANE